MKQYNVTYRTKAQPWDHQHARVMAISQKAAIQSCELTINAALDLRKDSKEGLKITARLYKPTIADIANNCGESHYFDLDTLKFFHQTRKDFSVSCTKIPTVFRTIAPILLNGKVIKFSIAFWELQNVNRNWIWVQVKNPEEGKEG